MWRLLGSFLFISLFAALSYATELVGHTDPIASVVISVTAVFSFAMMGRYLARRLHQPGVLGELLMGILVGNICYYFGVDLVVILREGTAIFHVMKDLLDGVSLSQAVNSAIPNPKYARQVIEALNQDWGTEYLKISYAIDVFSRYGVIFLLFTVGLETSLEELKHTGRESVWVAVIGMLAPLGLGFLVSYFLMPTASSHADLFIAATLTATSVGITVRVLAEMQQLKTREARTILGAAMLDDVLGLILLAVVSSVVISGAVDVWMLLRIIFFSLLFFFGTIFLAPPVLRQMVHFFRFLEPWESKLFISLFFVMLLAWLASLIHLAAIIGAFTAGVILNDSYFPKTASGDYTIKQLVTPIESILAPMFFILIGIQVKLETFFNWQVILLASALVCAAIIGKLLSGLGANRKDDRLLIGIGMLPRGEVGLVFASIGRTLGVVSDEFFAAIVLMIILTTVLAPPLLKARYASTQRRKFRK